MYLHCVLLFSSLLPGHPRFFNQLSSGLDIIGLAGEWLTSTANTNMWVPLPRGHSCRLCYVDQYFRCSEVMWRACLNAMARGCIEWCSLQACEIAYWSVHRVTHFTAHIKSCFIGHFCLMSCSCDSQRNDGIDTLKTQDLSQIFSREYFYFYCIFCIDTILQIYLEMFIMLTVKYCQKSYVFTFQYTQWKLIIQKRTFHLILQ